MNDTPKKPKSIEIKMRKNYQSDANEMMRGQIYMVAESVAKDLIKKKLATAEFE